VGSFGLLQKNLFSSFTFSFRTTLPSVLLACPLGSTSVGAVFRRALVTNADQRDLVSFPLFSLEIFSFFFRLDSWARCCVALDLVDFHFLFLLDSFFHPDFLLHFSLWTMLARPPPPRLRFKCGFSPPPITSLLIRLYFKMSRPRRCSLPQVFFIHFNFSG